MLFSKFIALVENYVSISTTAVKSANEKATQAIARETEAQALVLDLQQKVVAVMADDAADKETIKKAQDMLSALEYNYEVIKEDNAKLLQQLADEAAEFERVSASLVVGDSPISVPPVVIDTPPVIDTPAVVIT